MLRNISDKKITFHLEEFNSVFHRSTLFENLALSLSLSLSYAKLPLKRIRPLLSKA